jgi:serine/threonine protein kinase
VLQSQLSLSVGLGNAVTRMDTTITEQPPPAPVGLTPSDRVALTPRYEIVEAVGQGGMGVVYRAQHRLLNRQVALKACRPGTPVERFRREAQLLACVRSPHVVTVHDFELLEGLRPALVMEWINGRNLRELVHDAQGPLAEARVLPWMRQVCEGMLVAAEQGIIHRDLKPSNILIDDHDHACVADFGLACAARVDDRTVTGELMGTPFYMAPEQAEDPHGVDTRADIYSFGATFYHVLTGQPPFQGATAFTILFKHKTEPLIPPRARNPLLSTRTSECLERCLAKAPHQRFSTFQDVLASLQSPMAPSSPWDACEDPGMTRYLDMYQARRQLYLQGGVADLPEPDAYGFPQRRLLSIGFGNLVEQEVDALVSIVDPENWTTR